MKYENLESAFKLKIKINFRECSKKVLFFQHSKLTSKSNTRKESSAFKKAFIYEIA